MRVSSAGNLTVQLIRRCRFGVDPPACCDTRHTEAFRPQACCDPRGDLRHGDTRWRCVDKVELSREALASDAWALSACRTAGRVALGNDEQHALPAPIDLPPRTITPVVGSPALAGLGVSLVVPGTLLDVVA
jgi:hypothetical protein